MSNIETVVRAGGTATVSTQEAFTMDGARVEADRVVVDAKTLEITSPQDSSTFTSDARSTGVNVGYDFADKTLSVGGSYSKTDIDGDFVSVNEQSGIFAGEGGFDINIEEKATLNGAVVASEASPDLNSFRSAELEMNDLANRETFDASQMNVSASLSGGINSLGKATTGQDRLPGTQRPGLNAGLPTFFTAGDEQSGTTYSAIANGTIIIGGEDRSDDPGINNDTDGANDGALDQQFTDETRTEINDSFAAARILAAEGNTAFQNIASKEKEKDAEAKRKEDEAERNRKEAENPENSAEDREKYRKAAAEATAQAKKLRGEAQDLRDTFGPGSLTRLVFTAINGAAGGDVTNGLSGMGQSAVVNVLQGLGAQQIKALADGLGKETITENEDGTTTTTFTPTTESELLRSALQGIAGCAAGAAGGSGDCGSAAMGAAGSVAVNLLINSLTDEQDEATFDKDDNQTDADTEGDLQRSKNVTALIGLIAEGLGLDANAASTAGQIETENNQLGQENKGNLIQTSLCPPGQEAVCNTNNVIFLTTTTLGQLALQAAGGDKELAIKCAGADTSSECGVVRQRYNELSAALGAGWQQLDADTIVQRIAQIDAAESTLDQLFGDDEVRKQLTREFLADGSITSAGLEAKLAELKQREWDESTIGQLYNSVVSLFSSGDEVQPDFETETTPSGDPNDPKDKQNAIIMGMVLAVYAAAQGADVDLGNPPPFMPDQVGYTADDQPLFQDPGTDEYYVLDEQGNRQDVPLQSNVVKDYLAAKARLEQSPTPEKEIGITRDGKTIYRDQSGNEYVKNEDGRQISLQEYQGEGLANGKPTFKIGESDGGPGAWVPANENMSNAQRLYQQKVTGAPQGTAYNVPDPNVPSGRTSFDGFDPATNTLIDAKCWTCWPRNDLSFSNQSVVNQAFRQQRIAQQTGRTVEWHVPDEAAATRVRNAFTTAPDELRIDPKVVRIVVTPK
ncbi:Tox-REase-5 domain-containing protein [Alterisphingorhabdus coralli]|uniref:Tox-REase-5 domain-containing protein n=1 Tax=Alterisphingorhabdus coralli TaxID=3071408 RepID=A0AA97F9H3_9SPHN|nr:Tox-REase-5 domain-containing protein [Parasphingorhabdus sp. SCSIO 66989]WOE76616.1 Tox-REase-5 domain-containing protein [Parasphingorhabdus sp. SCSIO 66989]